jgi:crotonobetainyl-CoA:carnitine CoA-transferase CaiB-like acyl-CoA transferase
MLSMPGFGTTGPWRNYVTYGPNIEMVSGMPTISGYPGGAPMMTGYIADPIVGLMGAVAVMTALEHRRRTGEGQHIDFSQMEAVTTLMGGPLIGYSMNGRLPARRGNHHTSEAPYGVYPCVGDDQWVTIAVSSEEEWTALCEAMGSPPWASDAKYSDAAGRSRHHDELDKLIAEWTSSRDKHAVARGLQKVGVAAAPVLSYADVLSDEHLEQRGFFETITRPPTGTHPYPGFPAKLSETPLSIRRPAPTLGHDNEYVLGELLGMTAEEIGRLEQAEIIGTKPQGWAYAMEADEAISKLKDLHGKDA